MDFSFFRFCVNNCEGVTDLFQALLSTLDRENRTVDNGLITLLVETERGYLRQQVVEPGAGAGMAVGAGDCNVVGAIDRVVISHLLQRLENAIAHGRVSRLNIENEVNETVIRVFDIANDESAAVEALAQTGSLLGEIGVARETNLYDRAGDVGLAHANQIFVAISASRQLGARAVAAAICSSGNSADQEEEQRGEGGNEPEQRRLGGRHDERLRAILPRVHVPGTVQESSERSQGDRKQENGDIPAVYQPGAAT